MALRHGWPRGSAAIATGSCSSRLDGKCPETPPAGQQCNDFYDDRDAGATSHSSVAPARRAFDLPVRDAQERTRRHADTGRCNCGFRDALVARRYIRAHGSLRRASKSSGRTTSRSIATRRAASCTSSERRSRWAASRSRRSIRRRCARRAGRRLRLAWIGHFVFEKNKPASWGGVQGLLWSLRGDLRMWRMMLMGEMDAEVERINTPVAVA